MLDLATRLSALPAVQGRAPWPDHEYVKGWGVFALTFDSGHVLALRVFPEGDFGSYHSVWHRDPGGSWSIFVDGPRVETACPRYFGAACEQTAAAHIKLSWTGPASLHVVMDQPALDWSLTATSSPMLRVMNAISPRLPIATWRPRTLVRSREWMAARLGLGRLAMSGAMPSGHHGVLMPEQMYFVEEARALLEGLDLGRPAKLSENPKIGGVPVPARGVLAVGQGMWNILDHVEYERSRAEAAGAPS